MRVSTISRILNSHCVAVSHRGSRRLPICLRCVTAAFLAYCLGCGQSPTNTTPASLVQVSGRVTVDKQPLVRATVLFLPTENGSRARGVTDGNGEFSLLDESESAGIAPGEYRVVFQLLKLPGGDSSMQLDTNYQSPESTPVRIAITEDTDIVDFQLTKQASDYEVEA